MEIGVKNKIFTKTSTSDAHLYSNQDLRKLLVPIIVEQLLSSLMGTADTMMVSNVGSAAISAVSLVDSINILVIQALSALAAGGAILCSQYLGSSNKKAANESARQVLFVMTVFSVTLSAICLLFRGPLLHAIFGAVETDVMTNSQIYFLFTLLSFPFIGLYDAGASIMRAQNNSREPMIISIISNFLNIGGNAILIFVFGMGVEGAAISTLVSRIFCAVVVIYKLRSEEEPIFIKNYAAIRPDFSLIKKILFIGIPSGIENSMFQFG
ncbi:MATE domain protein, partial [Roseburia intestinalis L1-82]